MTAANRKLLPVGLLALLACVVGLAAGLAAALFRVALQHADRWRDLLIARVHDRGIPGFVLTLAVVAAAVALAAWCVRRFSPDAAGSGIPQVEAAIDSKIPPGSLILVPVKFVGGWLAIGAGLALGREGPSVQMGATLGAALAKAARLSEADGIALLAAGAGAGLATAFNAPIAGIAFVLEELVRRFDARHSIAALGASGAAIGVARLLIGQAPDFQVDPIPYPGIGTGLVFIALGAVAGLAGVAYNRAILAALALADGLRRWRVEIRAAIVGVLVGGLAFFAPELVGGGDAITQQTLSGVKVIALLPIVFVVRFLLGAVSYAAGTPGGLFAPMLTLGAQLGVAVAALARFGTGDLRTPTVAFGVVGMAAFFTAVVRAPLTGIILAVELTGSFTLLLPMVAAGMAAMLVPMMLGSEPIYDSLKERAVGLDEAAVRPA